MPRIPDYNAAGTTVPRTATPRFPADRSERIVAEGREALVGAVGAAVERAVDHDDKLRYASARGALLREQIAARKELEGDANYQTYESRFVERTAKARTAAAANIRGARSRELFEIDAQADIDRGLEQIRGLARAREVDEGIATMNNDLESNRTAALESSDPIERGALVKASLDSIDGTFKKGFIKEAEAGALRDKFKSNYGEAFVGIQTPAERIKLLEKPDDNVAKFIAPDRRKVLLEAAKKDNDEVRIRGESQAFFDGYIEKYGSDFNAAIKAARSDLKSDPAVRDATDQRLREEEFRVLRFAAEDQNDAVGEAQAAIDGGTKFADLPKSLMDRLKPGQRNVVRTYAARGGGIVTDQDTYISLLDQAYSQDKNVQRKFADLPIKANYSDKVSQADQDTLRKLQVQIRSGKLDGESTGYVSITQARDETITDLYAKTPAQRKQNAAEIDRFKREFERRQTALRVKNNRAIDIDEARAIIEIMTAEVVTKESFFGDTKKRAYQLTDEDVDVPATHRDAIIQVLRERGKPVTSEAIRAEYEQDRSTMFETPAPKQ